MKNLKSVLPEREESLKDSVAVLKALHGSHELSQEHELQSS